ncbi:MAG: aminoacyl-tRNA deacylase [Pseudomonadota bacterium]
MGVRAASTPAIAALRRAGVEYRLLPYAFDPESRSIGLDAAAALGVAPEGLLKTLVVDVQGVGLVLALIAVDRELDLKATASAVGGKRASLAGLAAAERATGYVKGGISPFGQRRRLPAVVDALTAARERVVVNGGRRGLQVDIRASDLVAMLDATTAPISVAENNIT